MRTSVCAGLLYCDSAGLSIAGSAYHNYGGGAEVTNGNNVSDPNPQHYSAAQLGITCPNGIYAQASGSTVNGGPVNFPGVVGGWGPPGFNITTARGSNASNHSC